MIFVSELVHVPYFMLYLYEFAVLIGFVVFSFAVVGSVHSRQLVQPLRALYYAVRQFNERSQLISVDVSGASEVRKLSHEFNEMVERIRQAESERTVLISGFVHDLRAPLTRMMLRLQMLEDDELRAAMQRDGEILSRLIAEMLYDDSQVSSGRTVSSVEAYCREHYGNGLDGEGLIFLKMTAGPDFSLPTVDVARILENTIDNALCYGEPPIEIESFTSGSSYHLIVRDFGPGVSSEKTAAMFMPFQRCIQDLDAKVVSDHHLGLGLAVVSRLVKRNGGSVSGRNLPDGGFEVVMEFKR